MRESRDLLARPSVATPKPESPEALTLQCAAPPRSPRCPPLKKQESTEGFCTEDRSDFFGEFPRVLLALTSEAPAGLRVDRVPLKGVYKGEYEGSII